MKIYSKRIKELRLARKISQDDLSRALGISRSAVGMYETGKREPDLETCEAIADYFNIDMDYLTGRSDIERKAIVTPPLYETGCGSLALFGERIKARRLELGLSVDQVAHSLKKNRATVYRYESNDIENFPTNIITPLAKVLHTTPAYLMGWEENPSQTIPSGFQPLPDMAEVPLIGRIACGDPITAEQNIEGVVAVPALWHADFTLTCEGGSMLPRIQDGDLVGIRKQPVVENGEIAAVRIDGEATLKHVYLYPNYIELRPENPAYESIIKIGEDMNSVKIEGKAVGLCRGL